ncbi:MAG: Ig-like domain-containing protein, partial [Terriglobales bacterium]
GSIALSAGEAAFSTAALAAGTHSITVVYVASTDYATSTSAVLSQVVDKASTKTTIASSLNPSTSGTTVTFTATVTAVAPGVGTPAGTVTFKNGTTTLGTGTLSAGKATFATSTLAEGTDSITAVYGGNLDFTTSTSGVVSQKVNP